MFIYQGASSHQTFSDFSEISSLQLSIIMCQLNNCQCCIGAALLFSHPGQASVILDGDLKNATIFSDASYMHWKKGYLASPDQHSSQACVQE